MNMELIASDNSALEDLSMQFVSTQRRGKSCSFVLRQASMILV